MRRKEEETGLAFLKGPCLKVSHADQAEAFYHDLSGGIIESFTFDKMAGRIVLKVLTSKGIIGAIMAQPGMIAIELGTAVKDSTDHTIIGFRGNVDYIEVNLMAAAMNSREKIPQFDLSGIDHLVKPVEEFYLDHEPIRWGERVDAIHSERGSFDLRERNWVIQEARPSWWGEAQLDIWTQHYTNYLKVRTEITSLLGGFKVVDGVVSWIEYDYEQNEKRLKRKPKHKQIADAKK